MNRHEGFLALAEILSEAGKDAFALTLPRLPSLINSLTAPEQRRLARVLAGNSASPMDLTPLLRHVLRAEMIHQAGIAPTLTVPVGQRWPTREVSVNHGLRVTSLTVGGIALRPEPWHPYWLKGTERVAVDEPAGAWPRRQVEPVAGDPFLIPFGFEQYRSSGQQQAVRSVLAAPPGATLLVNLPTGAGKSLCAHILARTPFTTASPEPGVTVVVVPTTALALDQERALRSLFGGTPLAYIGSGGDAGQKEKNQAIWHSVREGTQRILFTSPESLLGTLKSPVYHAAMAGRLKALVLDEAHLVEQWGDEFRSSFQELAGLRRGLMNNAPNPKFRTFLLSATLTSSSLETLGALFTGPGPCAMTAAVQLRPEPNYWVAACNGERVRSERVREALRYLPRPLILYVTRREDADNWYHRLHTEGYQRLGKMTGDTGTRERSSLITRWNADELDIMVATSAFGLGIDKPDVRAVVHACLPESLDRLYQEVGRGGRDGGASVSLVLHTPKDTDTARGLSQHKIITIEKGQRRWRAMFDNKLATLSDGRIRVNLAQPPGFGEDAIDMMGVRSQEWSARTLTLLQRAGVVALDDERTDVDTTETPASEERGMPLPTRTLTLLREDHLHPELWQTLIEATRARTALAEDVQWDLLQAFLRGDECVSEVLRRSYAIPALLSEGREPEETFVARACGGCAACRRQGKEDVLILSPTPSSWPWQPQTTVGQRLSNLLSGHDTLVLLYDATMTERRLRDTFIRILRWSQEQGVYLVLLPSQLRKSLLERERSVLEGKAIFFGESSDGDELREVPMLTLVKSGQVSGEVYEWRLRLTSAMQTTGTQRSPVILVLPDNIADPLRPARRFADMLIGPTLTVSEFEERENP